MDARTTRFLQDCQQRTTQQFQQLLEQQSSIPARLCEALSYVLLQPGKCLRPALVYAAGALFETPKDWLGTPANAIEAIHIYSLVHDDLPAMDDDDMRRGRATCHKAFDEATAILVGDCLQSMAYSMLSTADQLNPMQKVNMIQTLAQASGANGMVGGQYLDLQASGSGLSLIELKQLHRQKTAALISASLELGAIASGQTDHNVLESLQAFGQCIGLAFQIKDDILDIEGDSVTLGKPNGTDIRNNRTTYPSLIGLEPAKQHSTDLLEEAVAILDALPGDTSYLRALAHVMVDRNS